MIVKVDAIVLAGGQGTRLKGVLGDVPKTLAPINGVPFLKILLDQLDQAHIFKNVILSLGFQASRILDFVGENSFKTFNLKSVTESKPLGTGGALKLALSQATSNPVMVLNGDTYIETHFDELLKFHFQKKSKLTMTLASVSNASRYGRVKIGKNSEILEFSEKSDDSQAGLINAGVILFDPDLFEDIRKNEFLSFERDIIPKNLSQAFGYVTHGRFIDIGTPESFNQSLIMFPGQQKGSK